MTKTIMDGRSVCHVWAQQEQHAARSYNGQFYFEGPTLFSYGPHFAIGRFVTNQQGAPAVLLNSDSYSVTTSKHQSWAANAVHGLGIPVFEVPGAEPHHLENVKALAEGAAASLVKAKRAREYKDHHLQRAADGFERAKAYAAFFGVKFRPANIEAVAEELEAAKRREAIRQKREVAAWRAGERSECPGSYRTDERGGAYLRIVGDELQTSLGARVPLAHAIRAFRFIKLVRARGEGWKANGHSIRVGHFNVSEISKAGDMVAGCHRFSWAEIQRAAEEAGVADLPPAAEALETAHPA